MPRNRAGSWISVAAASVALAAFLAGSSLARTPAAPAPQGAAPSRFNYRDHVLPVLEEHCGACHQRGGAAQVTLLEYVEAVPWSHTMTRQVLEGRMPPFLPVEGVGDFVNRRTLSAAEIDVLVDWAVGGMPEGEPFLYDEEAAPGDGDDGLEGWHIGQPDLVLRPAEPVLIDDAVDERELCVVLPTGLQEPRLATAFELKPNLRSVVQRATVTLGEACAPFARPLFTWLPDQRTIPMPAGAGELLPAGSSLALQIVYRWDWELEGVLEDRSALGMKFSDSEETIESIRIVGSPHSFDAPVRLLALFPDPEGTGRRSPASSAPDEARADPGPVRVEVVRPGEPAETLLLIEHFEAAFREKYVFREPVALPAGATLRISPPAVWVDYATGEAPASSRR